MRILFLLIVLVVINGCDKVLPHRAMVVSKIRDVSKLASVEFVVTKMVMATKEKRFLRLVKLNDATFFAQTEATIKVGIDLSKLNEEDITIENNKIKLTLPPVEVLNFSYPADKFHVDEDYSNTNPFGNKLGIEDIDKIYQDAQLQVMRDANFLGLRSTAESKTIMLLNNLLEKIGFEEVYVQFKESTTPLFSLVEPVEDK